MNEKERIEEARKSNLFKETIQKLGNSCENVNLPTETRDLTTEEALAIKNGLSSISKKVSLDRIAELERENETLKNDGLSKNFKHFMWYVKRVDELQKENDMLKHKGQNSFIAVQFGLKFSQTQKQALEIAEKLKEYCDLKNIEIIVRSQEQQEQISQLQKENSYLKEELEAISEVLPHHVGRNETGVSIIDDVKDLTKEALEFASTIKKLEKENSELKGKIERAIVCLEKIEQEYQDGLRTKIDGRVACDMRNFAKQTLSELKGEK